MASLWQRDVDGFVGTCLEVVKERQVGNVVSDSVGHEGCTGLVAGDYDVHKCS